MTDERRHYSRVKFDAELTIETDGKVIVAHLLDISLKGALVELTGGEVIEKNTKCNIQIKLNGNELVLDFEATAVFVKDEHTGFEFDHIELDSLTHLRRLVELNVGDSDKVKGELFFLATHKIDNSEK